MQKTVTREDILKFAAACLGSLILGLASPAAAQGVLNVYCSVQIEWCTLVANEFQKATGIKVSMTQKGSGETIAQLKAEAQNPKGDVWFGGTGDPHLQAAEEGLTDVYKSPRHYLAVAEANRLDTVRHLAAGQTLLLPPLR